jgi:hypothetical protein
MARGGVPPCLNPGKRLAKGHCITESLGVSFISFVLYADGKAVARE